MSNEKMPPDDAIAMLSSLKDRSLPNWTFDVEANHALADEILCSVLNYLGHYEVVHAYNLVEPKLYG